MQKTLLNKFFTSLILLLIFSCMFAYSLFSQKPGIAQEKDSVQIDKTPVSVEKVPWNKIDEFRKDKAFNYNFKEKKGINFLPRIINWLGQLFESIFSSTSPVRYIWRFFVLVVIGFIIYLIIGADISGIFRRNKKVKTPDGFEYFDEDIHSQDLDKNLRKAIAEQDYRKAIRYYYLKLLKQMDLSELINWKISKTNHDYIYELSNKPLLKDFKILSGIYEYTWYGNFAVDQKNFNSWQSDFQIAIRLAAQK